MKIKQFLLDKIVGPLLVVLLSSIIFGVGSKINTGYWTGWFGRIPRVAWVIFAAVFFLWVIIIVIRKRIKQLKKLNYGAGVHVIAGAVFGWIDIGKFNYVGVKWRIQAPAPAPWESFNPMSISPSDIEVGTPPRCPKCETELEQLHSFWGGYIWRCVGCSFRKRSGVSYYLEAERVTKIARREWERQKHERLGI